MQRSYLESGLQSDLFRVREHPCITQAVDAPTCRLSRASLLMLSKADKWGTVLRGETVLKFIVQSHL